MRRILFLALFVAILSSCGVQSSTSNNTAQANASEETTSLKEALVGDETTEQEPGDSTPAPAHASDAPEPTQSTLTEPATGSSGMVSSANPYATQAGLEILDEGGNAFDAAVAVAAALNVVEPMMSGAGGYGAIVIYDAQEGRTRFLDTGSRTPAALDPEVFRSSTPNYLDNRCGAKAVATPGNVNAWERLSEDYGKLDRQRLFDPAIKLADEGFVLDRITAGWVAAAWPAFPEYAKGIYGKDGVPLGAGDTLVQKDLARSLGVIAEQGAGAMYEGELGQEIEAAVQENGGFLTRDDLHNNQARWRDTISMDYRGYEVVTAPPPATSWGALLRLGVMSQFRLEPSAYNTVSYLHTFAEANKQVSLATRNYAADPEIASTPLDMLLSQEYWAELAANINPSQASPNFPSSSFGAPTPCIPQSYTAPAYAPTATSEAQSHTTHFVVADKEGNVVSATQTLGDIFGSKVMPEGTGIWLNDAI
ncbi:MAG: gamma-glutamyltranspeptidase / glutathione hydrolase, partial [Rubrobacteraceae bacterium]|nr:gamma-glutamyltranspeptidase / glutathione hydrolase [Rubrobacteraceae bacterium]